MEDLSPNIKTQKDTRNLEWLKTKLGTLWSDSKYCGLCLEIMSNLHPLKTEFAINECYSTVPLRDVLNIVFHCEIEDYMSSELICEECTEKTILSYVFIQNTKKVFNILTSCVNDLLSKTTDLTNELEENLDYEDANVIIVVEYDNETYQHIDEITSGNSAILTDKPIQRKQIQEPVKNCNSSPKDTDEVEKPKISNKENKGPIIIPTQRVIKHPRSKELPTSKVYQNAASDKTPTVSLEGGKIVIAPLVTNTPSAPKYNTYKCNSCPSIFTTYRSLKEHEKSLHKTTIFQCRFCSKKYNSQQYLDVHYEASHSKTRCRYCSNLFNNNELNNHLKSNHEKQVNCCKYCDLVYYTVEQLETHCKSTHFSNIKSENDSKTFCVMCLRNFKAEEIKLHKCKFSCLECPVVPCVHYSYLMSFREQVLTHFSKIQCLDCDYTTKRKEHLIAHVNREHLDYHPFTCDDCGTQFYTKLSLKTHIVQFHQDLRCQYCDHEFKNGKLLQNHRSICKTITREHSCVKCVSSFDTEQELSKHVRQSHSDIVFPCTLCKREFTNELALEEHHARVHSGIQYKKRRKFIECTLCDITFKNIKEMLKHEELHDTDEVYPCKVCAKTFNSLKKVYVHKQRHYSQRTKCPGCKKLLASSYFTQHKAVCLYLKETRNPPYNCDICSETFNSETKLQLHLQNHAKTIPCEFCHKLIKPGMMKKHMEQKHLNDPEQQKILKCEFCDYTTKKKYDFENHVNKMHLKIKPYICHVCNKSFCGKSRLDEHEKTHSDNNVCFCNYCGKKFANKVCLKMHTRRHTGEKPYQCNICLESFRSSSIMKTHRLKKHQDKTIQCPLCDSMYHLAAEMRFHVKKVHWKRPTPFDYKQIVPEKFYHLFEDRRLQKLGEDVQINRFDT